MAIPKRVIQQTGRFSKVDGISYRLPINSDDTAVIMAAFPADYEKARAVLPGNEIHPVRLMNGKAVFIVTVVDYRLTDIGKYIEYSIALACTHGAKPAPRVLPAVFMKAYGTGQYVIDLPVSTEISVKGGKGVWGMPKHQANLDIIGGEDIISAQYDKDGKMVMRLDIKRPSKTSFSLSMGAANYCRFRGCWLNHTFILRERPG